jgi:aryl-alcohol dehydrogenase-like predicted oxidoreductase
MHYRSLGKTGLRVSTYGFGAWAIGGKSYGAANRDESLEALAVAEELGCNFVDTAAVYGASEEILGEFLATRRDRWIVASKYSGQAEGMERTLEQQLRRLRTDRIDLYQIHWAPARHEESLYRTLEDLKRGGKVRYAGVSVYSPRDIESVLARPEIDAIQIACSLLDPLPYTPHHAALSASGIGVVVRSVFKEGFLTGKFGRDVRFADADDRRTRMSEREIADRLRQVELLRTLTGDSLALKDLAVRYPHSFSATSVVLLGTKNAAHARENFGQLADEGLPPDLLARLGVLQKACGCLPMWQQTLRTRARAFARRLLHLQR